MKRVKTNFKRGAASFYVVAFSTLVLIIVVASFTSLVIAQLTRSSNDDLSQSAYDSALAGVEDAKLAYYNYQNCIAQGIEGAKWSGEGTIDCAGIIDLVEESNDDCDEVAKILGRNIVDGVGVSVEETSKKDVVKNNMQQTYTCTKIQTSLPDYRASLSASNPTRVINVKLDDMGKGEYINADAVEKIRVSWGAELAKSDVTLSNYNNGNVEFPKITGSTKAAVPPTISLAVVQAGNNFSMSDFDKTSNGETNRGMVYLTPVTTEGKNTEGKDGNYYGTTFGVDSGGLAVSKIDKNAVVASNNLLGQNPNINVSNYSYGVSCPYAGVGSGFTCSAMVYLPKPVGGVRSNDNFMVAMSLPYGASTDVILEFFCGDGVVCGEQKMICEEGDSDCDESTSTNQVNLKDVQIGIDSTGRANDLFRRVETRLEGTDGFAVSIMGPLELFGAGGSRDNPDDSPLNKNYPTTCEYNFDPKTCN